jgi:enoyl-CoA hydratase/carnithine racemase
MGNIAISMSRTSPPNVIWSDAVLSDGRTLRRIVLNRPRKRNCLNLDDLWSLCRAVTTSGHDVLALTARPPAFCAGFDLDALRQSLSAPPGLARMIGALYAVYLRILRHSGTTIAIVDGPAVGGGAGLALCCDCIIAARGSSFLLPRGPLRPLANIVAPLAVRRRLPDGLGAPISAEQALACGAVDVLIDHSPAEAMLYQLIQSSLAQGSLVNPSRARPALDRRDACERIRAAIERDAVEDVTAFLTQRRDDVSDPAQRITPAPAGENTPPRSSGPPARKSDGPSHPAAS